MTGLVGYPVWGCGFASMRGPVPLPTEAASMYLPRFFGSSGHLTILVGEIVCNPRQVVSRQWMVALPNEHQNPYE
jgi:hypothetical protein